MTRRYESVVKRPLVKMSILNYFRIAVIMVLFSCLSVLCPHPATAQGGVFGYFTDGFIYQPQLFGDTKFGPRIMSVIHGQDVYNMYDKAMFFDVFARAGVGRLSFRLVYEPRSFVGRRIIDGIERQTRFEFEGVRLGVGADLIRRPSAIAGISLDYDAFPPQLSGPVMVNSRWDVDVITGKQPLSLGAYATYTAPVNVFGMMPTVDASFRTSVMGAQLQDYRVAAGLQLPTNVYGTMSVLAGYQNTALKFNKSVADIKRTVDIGYAGWFVELAYYY